MHGGGTTPIDEVEQFTHLGSVVSTTGVTDQESEGRVRKARAIYRAMDWYIWYR